MHWKNWLLNYAPKSWSVQDKYNYIKQDCPNITLDMVKRAIIAQKEITTSNIGRAFANYLH